MQRSHGIMLKKPGRLTETYLVFRIFKNCKISENCISLKALKNLKPAGGEEPQSSAISDMKARSTVHKLTRTFHAFIHLHKGPNIHSSSTLKSKTHSTLLAATDIRGQARSS